jgi:hypothetical protein
MSEGDSMRNAIGCLILGVSFALAGCGGGDETVRETGLPVACVAKAKPGNCGGSVPKVYFDYRDNRCKTFYWSGCGGFVPYQTMEACRKECEAGSGRP